MAKKNKIDNFLDAVQNTGYSSDLASTTGINDNRLKFGEYFLTDSKQEDIIKALGGLGSFKGSELATLLSLLGINQNGDMTGAQMDDWNKQIMDSLLSTLSEQDKRNYNEGIRDEQRLYDNPQNQLARLMGAGISRDAAIQMLSGGSGSGSGGLVTGDAAAMSMGIPATQSDLNKAQERVSIAQTVFSGIGALTGLVNLGFSAPHAIAQTQYLLNQNLLTGKQIKSLESAGQAFNILNAAGAAAESFGSVASASAAISQLAKNGNQDAASFIAGGGIDAMRLNAPFASKTLGTLYQSERASADYAGLYYREARRYDAENDLNQVQFRLLSQEVLNAQAEYNEIAANTEFIEANKQLQKALKLKVEQETTALNFQNLQTDAIFNGSFEEKSYLQWLSDDSLMKLVTDARLSQKTSDPEYSAAVYKQMFNTANSVAVAMSLAALRDQSGLDFFNKYPQQAALYSGLQKVGAYEYLDAVVKKNTSGNYRLPFGIGGSTSGLYFSDIDPLKPPFK